MVGGKQNLDDINLENEYWYNGDPILFTNPEIRRMFTLASLGQNDVFYDLGSGYGQNVLIALSEFKVRKAYGIEADRERVWRSRLRLEEAGIPADKGKILFGWFDKVLTEHRLREATVIFYGLEMDNSLLAKIKRVWKTDNPPRRLIYYHRHISAKIMPTKVDYPFFVSVAPFQRPKSDVEWLSKVVLQPEEMISKLNLKRNVKTLWDEFSHNQDVLGFRNDVENFRAELAKAPRSRKRSMKAS